MQALLDARQDENEWPGVFASTTGLVFFWHPVSRRGGNEPDRDARGSTAGVR